jgi:hypothetical protein
MTFQSIEEIKQANKASGRHFFSPDTMRFFNSIVYDDVFPHHNLPQTFFITSEKMNGMSARYYMVRCAHPDGSMSSISKIDHKLSKTRAYTLARKLSQADNPDFSDMYSNEIEKYVAGLM